MERGKVQHGALASMWTNVFCKRLCCCFGAADRENNDRYGINNTDRYSITYQDRRCCSYLQIRGRGDLLEAEGRNYGCVSLGAVVSGRLI